MSRQSHISCTLILQFIIVWSCRGCLQALVIGKIFFNKIFSNPTLSPTFSRLYRLKGTLSFNFGISLNKQATLDHVLDQLACDNCFIRTVHRIHTEREALALKEGLIKFQAYIEGETILAVTDHAALTWSKTFQNVNRRLLTWGTVFAAYPNLRIVHRAGRVHSNVDPISQLRRRIPYQQGPTVDATQHISLDLTEDPIRDMYSELGEKFEEKLLSVVSDFVASETLQEPDYSFISPNSLKICLPSGHEFSLDHVSSNSYSVLVGMKSDELNIWKTAYASDTLFSKVLRLL